MKTLEKLSNLEVSNLELKKTLGGMASFDCTSQTRNEYNTYIMAPSGDVCVIPDTIVSDCEQV